MTTMMRSPPVPFKADGHNYRPELAEPTRSNRLVCLKTPSGKPNWAFKSTPIWCIMFALLLVTIVISLLIIERQQYGLVVADNDDGKVHVRIGKYSCPFLFALAPNVATKNGHQCTSCL